MHYQKFFNKYYRHYLQIKQHSHFIKFLLINLILKKDGIAIKVIKLLFVK